jgi:hypothetical protein
MSPIGSNPDTGWILPAFSRRRSSVTSVTDHPSVHTLRYKTASKIPLGEGCFLSTVHSQPLLDCKKKYRAATQPNTTNGIAAKTKTFLFTQEFPLQIFQRCTPFAIFNVYPIAVLYTFLAGKLVKDLLIGSRGENFENNPAYVFSILNVELIGTPAAEL